MGTDSAKSPWYDRAGTSLSHAGTSRVARTITAAVPVVLVNATAFTGQLGFLNQHVPWPGPGRVLIAVTLETVAIYIMFHAHAAQMANDSATRLKLGAYTFALIIGGMNYSHYAGPNWRPTFMAVAMFLMSTLSPWLWNIHSRRTSRDALMAQGLIEPHAVRLGANRWMWHGLRCFRAMYWATWHGVNDPQRVVEHFQSLYGTPDQQHAVRQAERVYTAPAVPAGPVQETAPAPVPVPAPAPVQQPAAITAPDPYHGAQLIPGTQLNGTSVVRAEARMSAEPVAAGPLTNEMIKSAELYLAGLPDGGPYPGQRTLAAQYLGSEGRRREAKRLLDARKAAEVRLPDVTANGHRSSQMIATPLAQLPGGVNG